MSSQVPPDMAAKPSRAGQLRWVLTTFLAVLALDQATKAAVVSLLEPRMPARFDIFFHLTHQHNYGIVGGLFSEVPFVAFIAPTAATLVLIYLYRHLDPAVRLQALAFGMILGGAIGNITDRVRHGYVTDFLQFYFSFLPEWVPWRYYPAFNVADSCIVVGVTVLVITWNAPAAKAANAPHPV